MKTAPEATNAELPFTKLVQGRDDVPISYKGGMGRRWWWWWWGVGASKLLYLSTKSMSINKQNEPMRQNHVYKLGRQCEFSAATFQSAEDEIIFHLMGSK